MIIGLDQEATGKRIKKLCTERGLLARELAAGIGYPSTPGIYKWFTGTAMPNYDNLLRIADFLGVAVDDILVARED